MIKTKKFTLRNPRKEDINELWDNYNDKEIAKNMVSMEKEKEFKSDWINKFKNKKDKSREIDYTLVIEIEKKPAGLISIRSTDEYNKTKATISYRIGKNYRGRGITTQALKLFTVHALKKFKLTRIQANVRIFNKTSARILEKVGYKLEGIRRKNVYKNGKFYDDLLYAKVK